jgi:hypothetical protein
VAIQAAQVAEVRGEKMNDPRLLLTALTTEQRRLQQGRAVCLNVPG